MAIPRRKSPIYLTIYPKLKGEDLDSCLSQGVLCYVKCKQPRPGLELVSPCLFWTTKTIKPWVPYCVCGVPIEQLYYHRPPISQTIHVRWTRHAGHCCRSKDEVIGDVPLWTSAHGRASIGRPAKTCQKRWVRGKNGERESQGTPCCRRDLMMVINCKYSHT